MFNLTVKLDIRTKDFESKVYFIVFGLVAVLLAIQIYNLAFDTFVGDQATQVQNLGVFKPHIDTADLGR